MTKRVSESAGSCSCATTVGVCGKESVLVDITDVRSKPSWVTGFVATAAGLVPQVATVLATGDVLGSWKARWGIRRMEYQIPPGLYAAGTPDSDSVVLVSANYKMSFDRLRKELAGVNAWILVLDTHGINVWCAAGKGTFGTKEIGERIARVRLSEVVTHRTLIVPQRGAPGVAAHEVRRQTGFRVIYGPVRAEDLPAFLEAGNKATPRMREMKFGFVDRLILTPMELVAIVKPTLILLALLFLLNLITDASAPFLILLNRSLVGLVPFLAAAIIGSVVVPALLPFIPGRSFAWKGWLCGVAWALAFIFFSASMSWTRSLFYLLVLPSIASYLAMNFTGATTYTSPSGVVREMKIGLPVIIISALLGVVSLIAGMIIRL